jgi:hypothetical protein
VLLTRSPLSPGPKPWFSLDLHVLSAPPAFVLSQDQTLREDGLPLPAWDPQIVDPRSRRLANLPSSLCSKVYPNRTGADGLLLDSSRARRCDHARERSRRKRSLLSFQRPALASRRRKKASDSRQRPPVVQIQVVSESSWRRSVRRVTGTLLRRREGSRGMIAASRRGVSRRGNLQELALSGLDHRAREPLRRQLELMHRLAVDFHSALLDHAPPVAVRLPELVAQ